MDPCEEDADLDRLESDSQLPPNPSDIVPSLHRFFISYSAPDEARHIAQWLAKMTNKAIDVVPNDRGRWVFSEAAISCAERYYTRFSEDADWRSKLEQELIDDDLAALEHSVDRLVENQIEQPTCRLNVNEDGESLI